MRASFPDSGRPRHPRLRLPILLLFFTLAIAAGDETQPILGATLPRTGQTKQAFFLLKRAPERESQHSPKALEKLASTLLSSARYEAAAGHYERLCQLNPKNPRAWFGLGRSYQALSQEHFESLQTAAPDSVYGLLLTAENLFKEGNHRQAFHLYRQALEKDPRRPGIHQALSKIYRVTGHLDWAEVEEAREAGLPATDCRTEPLVCEFAADKFMQVAVAAKTGRSPQSDYWLSRAYARMATGAYQELGHLPPSLEFYRWKAGEYLSQGLRLKAIAEWKKALRLWPASPEIEKELALSLHLGRDYEAALPLFRQLLADDPTSVELNLLCGDTLLFLQQPEQAVSYLKTALRSDPTSLKAQAAVGLALVQMGDVEKAIPYLRRSLSIDSKGSLHYQLAQAYRLTGRLDSAEATLRRYREIQRSLAEEFKRSRNWMDQARITPP